MTTESRVLAMFVEANPIRDPDALEFDDADTATHLESLETRSTVMTATIERTVDRRPANGRWIAAAIVAATLGVVALFAATRPSEPILITTLDQRIEVIEALVAVHNSGDFDAFRDQFSDAPEVFGGTVESDVDWEFQRSFIAANEQWEFSGSCEEHSVQGRVACPMTLENDFMGPAGLYFDVPALRFEVSQAGNIEHIGAEVWRIAGDPEDYFAAFDAWLNAAHPEVHAGLGPRVEDWGMLPSAEDMPSVLPYVDEFLAQSADYPLEAP